MLRRTQISSLLLLASLPLTACTRNAEEEALVRGDFDRICNAQKDFLQALKLPGVNHAELVVERTKRMREGMKAPQALATVNQLIQPDAQDQRALVEKAAGDAGLKGWTCAELAQGP